MAVITIPIKRETSEVKRGTRCCHRMRIPKRGRYAGSGASAKTYSFGRAKSAGRCPNFADALVNGKPYCRMHAPAQRTEAER